MPHHYSDVIMSAMVSQITGVSINAATGGLPSQRFCCTKTGSVPTLNLPHQNRLCIGTKPAVSFWINISTVSEVRRDCQGLGLVARIEASILEFDTMQVCIDQFWDKSSFVASTEDAKPVLIQNRFCIKAGFVAWQLATGEIWAIFTTHIYDTRSRLFNLENKKKTFILSAGAEFVNVFTPNYIYGHITYSIHGKRYM